MTDLKLDLNILNIMGGWDPFWDVLEIIRFIRSAMSAFINSSMLEPSSYS